MTRDRQKRAERLQLMLTQDEIEYVDNWRFEHKMPSRSAAVRALLRLAVDVDSHSHGTPMERGAVGISSADVGILAADKRVDQVVGISTRGDSVLVVGTDMLICHATKSLLTDAGYHVSGPVMDAEAIPQDPETRFRAVVVVAGHARKDFENMVSRVLDLKVPILVASISENADDLPVSIEGVRVVSFLSMPETLINSMNSLLGTSKNCSDYAAFVG